MTMRTSEKTVTFKNPFVLGGLDGVQPAGVYSVETDEELLEGVSFPAYRRISTWIRLHAKPDRPGIVQTSNIDPKELDAALMRDAVPEARPVDRGSLRKAIETMAESRADKADIAAEERSEDDGMTEHPKKAADPAAWAADRAARAGTGRPRNRA